MDMETGPRRRVGDWLWERLGLEGLAYRVPEHANRLPYALGGITLTGFVVLFLTGIYLAQFYHPHPIEAHSRVVYIITGAPLGHPNHHAGVIHGRHLTSDGVKTL